MITTGLEGSDAQQLAVELLSKICELATINACCKCGNCSSTGGLPVKFIEDWVIRHQQGDVACSMVDLDTDSNMYVRAHTPCIRTPCVCANKTNVRPAHQHPLCRTTCLAPIATIAVRPEYAPSVITSTGRMRVE